MSEKPDVWMPLYVGDWERRTKHLDCEQDGAYGRLVRYYWVNGPPPDDDAALARVVGMTAAKWRKTRPILATFFFVESGHWFHDRVERELDKARKIIAKRRAAGMLGGRPKKANGSVLLSLSETPARVTVTLSDRGVVTDRSQEAYQERKQDSQEETPHEGKRPSLRVVE